MSIDLVFQFLGEQWLLVVALIATLTMLVLHEGRKAGPALSVSYTHLTLPTIRLV